VVGCLQASALNAANFALGLLARLSFVMAQKWICNVDGSADCVMWNHCWIEQRDFLMCKNNGKDFLMEFLEKVCLESHGLLLLPEQCD
jgi:hypothetical protein